MKCATRGARSGNLAPINITVAVCDIYIWRIVGDAGEFVVNNFQLLFFDLFVNNSRLVLNSNLKFIIILLFLGN